MATLAPIKKIKAHGFLLIKGSGSVWVKEQVNIVCSVELYEVRLEPTLGFD